MLVVLMCQLLFDVVDYSFVCVLQIVFSVVVFYDVSWLLGFQVQLFGMDIDDVCLLVVIILVIGFEDVSGVSIFIWFVLVLQLGCLWLCLVDQWCVG